MGLGDCGGERTCGCCDKGDGEGGVNFVAALKTPRGGEEGGGSLCRVVSS